MGHPRQTLQLFGVAKLNGRLRELSGPEYSKVLRKGMRAGIKVIEKAQKAATPILSVKQAIGSRLLKQKEGFGAKAGAAVGKKKKPTAAALRKAGKRHRGGVGISARNIHWYVLGTQMRETGTKRTGANSHKRGANPRRVATGRPRHSTGRMPAHGFIRAASEAASSAAVTALQETVRTGLDALWRAGKL
jgi:hypothetical protein